MIKIHVKKKEFGLSGLQGSKKLSVNLKFQNSSNPPSLIATKVITSMKNIFDGDNNCEKFNIVNEQLSSYAWKILEVVSLVKGGYVASYGGIARASGGTPRIVGRIIGLNPYPLIIPCHRIICSNLTLGGYSKGHKVKEEILCREKRGYSEILKILLRGETLDIYPVESIKNKSINKC